MKSTNNIRFVSPVVAQASVSVSKNDLVERPAPLKNRPSGEEIRPPEEIVPPAPLVNRESCV
ncbi:MAG: hypothetical protein LBF94_01495 [Puniceicoccales bacterium]|nr:hypothetical protein [Puniceicoccales bacterium]